MTWHRPITQNFGIKVMAAALAAALYLHVVTERSMEEVHYFPAVFTGLSDTLAFRQALPDRLGARLRGTGKQLLWLRAVEPAVRVDLTGVGPGEYQKALAPEDFASATGGEIEVLGAAEPTHLALQIEPRAARTVAVAVRVRGEPAAGYLLSGPVQARPDSARLSGPVSWIAEHDGIETQVVDIGGLRAGVERPIGLVAPPPWATVAPGSVLVRVPVEPREEGEAMARPQILGVRAESFTTRLDPQEVRLVWSAPQSAAKNALARVRVHVDLEQKGRGRYLLPVVVSGPGAEFVVRVEPESVAVTIH